MLDAVSTAVGAASQPLTASQQAAWAKLKDAAQQFEGIFVGMLFKEMHTVPKTSITGVVSEADRTFSEMLDQNRADALAKTGAFGIAKILEQQLRASVLGIADVPVASMSLGAPSSSTVQSTAPTHSSRPLTLPAAAVNAYRVSMPTGEK
jgi:Rod binding domain-containing protein